MVWSAKCHPSLRNVHAAGHGVFSTEVHTTTVQSAHCQVTTVSSTVATICFFTEAEFNQLDCWNNVIESFNSCSIDQVTCVQELGLNLHTQYIIDA